MATENYISSTAGAFRLRWDVFLSFRGTDTRIPFIEPLYNALHSAGVRVFRDTEGLDCGDEISPSLLEAIDDSAASIVVLSPNYASSRFCLTELVKICDSGRLILPVFYKVEPSHVRRQKGPFEEAFKINEDKFEKNEVQRWRNAMQKVGDLSGFVLLHQSSAEEQATLIRRLVEKVSGELKNTPVGVGEFTVGLDKRVDELTNLLEIKSNGFRVLGLYGMGGVGKTTLAKTLFNYLVPHFQHRTFISNVRQTSSKDDGLISLQKRIITELSGSSAPVNINDVHSGAASIKRIVEENRVLIILDDVDSSAQLDSLIGKKEWFYEGSRVIITTRDRQVLIDNYINNNMMYEVKELGSDEALELFSYHALRRKEPTDEFLGLSKKIVKLTGGLPLALEVFGSFLFDKRRAKEEWIDALEKLERIRPQHLQDVLKISYDGLDEEEKNMFLDIACLLVRMEMKREDVVDVMRGCGFSAELGITVLTTRCLIKIYEDSKVVMHDQIIHMARQIVRQESPLPAMRTRLWNRPEIFTVLKENKGTGSTQGITLDFQRKILLNDAEVEAIISGHNSPWLSILNPFSFFKPRLTVTEKELTLETKSFESMINLRLLQINNLILEGKFTSLPSELKWLQWQGCPFRNLPSDFWSQKFTVLDLSYSKLESLWGWRNNKVPKNLKVLNLSYCSNLTSVPDLSGCTSLDKIVLQRCTALTRIHESTGSLNALHDLNLSYCVNLEKLPNDVSGLRNLENLVLSHCSKLKALPANIGLMKSLRKLLVDNTAIAELPEAIFSLEKLEKLVLDGCQNLKRLPNCIGSLTSLQELSLNQSAIEELPDSVGSLASLEILSLVHCGSLTKIPDSIGNLVSLTRLSVNGSGISELPPSIGSLSFLKTLSAGGCKDLSNLPDSIYGLVSLVELQLDGTSIENLPDQIGAMIVLRNLELRNCKNLVSLPESIGNLAALTTLDIRNVNIEELPESIGLLENLVTLTVNKCRKLRQLPESITNLKNLHHLMMEETKIKDLPETFGKLSRLMTLQMTNRPHLIENGDDSNAGEAETADHSFQFPNSFYDLTLLNVLDARAWRISGEIPNDFEKLSSLETLDLSLNNFHSLPSSLKGLSILKKLWLRDCSELRFLPPLPSSLIELNAEKCTSLESIADLANLGSLQELNFTLCEKVVDIPGLECLKSVKRLFLSDCIACSSQIRKRLSKVALRNLRSLSMPLPGSKFPEWFSGQTVNFTKQTNRELLGVVVCVVLSINHDLPNGDAMKYCHHMPGVVDVQAQVFKSDRQVYCTTLNISGVPKTNKEHIHLCRFADVHPLVHFLRDGGTLCVTKSDPPIDKRLELKNSGILLIFEGDDEYSGDERFVDQNLKTVSEKMAAFFKSLEDETDVV